MIQFPAGPGRSILLDCPPGVHVPGPSSRHLAEVLSLVRDRSVLDLGCGSGLLACTAAARGARGVWATDVDPLAVACCAENAARNGLSVQTGRGDLFEPVGDRRFDWIVSNPPQTPAPPEARGPKFAGEDGLAIFERLLGAAPRHLTEAGGLLTSLISLADTRRFESLLGAAFRWERTSETRRPFTRAEYDGYHPGLFGYLEERRRRGCAEFEPDGDGYVFCVRYYRAFLK